MVEASAGDWNARAAELTRVRLEFLPSLAETLGVEATAEETIVDRDGSVRILLRQLCTRYPRFGQAVFGMNSQELTGRVAIFLNGCALELMDGLESKLSDGDIVAFVPIIEGG